MVDLSQVSGPAIGLMVFVILLALRCGLMWVGLSAVLASLVASDPFGVVDRLSYVFGIDSQEFVARLAQVLAN